MQEKKRERKIRTRNVLCPRRKNETPGLAYSKRKGERYTAWRMNEERGINIDKRKKVPVRREGKRDSNVVYLGEEVKNRTNGWKEARSKDPLQAQESIDYNGSPN